VGSVLRIWKVLASSEIVHSLWPKGRKNQGTTGLPRIIWMWSLKLSCVLLMYQPVQWVSKVSCLSPKDLPLSQVMTEICRVTKDVV